MYKIRKIGIEMNSNDILALFHYRLRPLEKGGMAIEKFGKIDLFIQKERKKERKKDRIKQEK